LSLLVSDYLYFSALREPGVMVSLVISLRRANALVAFAGGLLLFGERSNWQKILAVIGILLGVVLTVIG
jgi:drug/metabolite transporter (DMT)-like permease